MLLPNGKWSCNQRASGTSVHQQLKKLGKPYSELETFLGLQPLEVALLPENASQNCELTQLANGANPARVKIPHINPPDSILDFLLNGSARVLVNKKEHQLESIQSK